MIVERCLRQLRKEDGAVTLEMAFVIIGFVLLLVIITDFGITMLKHSKLERVAASVATVFRERETLYSNNKILSKYESEYIDQEQTDKLGELAVSLMGDQGLTMRVDALFFAAGAPKIIEKSETFYFIPPPSDSNSSPSPCAENIPQLDEYSYLSQYSGFERWMPLYRITVCLPGNASLYKFITNNGGDEKTVNTLTVSNITIPR